jgi:hypothetical protein
MKADGSTAGGACTAQGECTSPLSCDTGSGLCVAFKTNGNYGDPCYQNTDCDPSGKYPGLLCTQTDGKTQGTCDCTPDSGILKQCKDDSVCASGSSPSPSPGPSSWPAAFPNPTDGERAQFDGDCSKAAWYTKGTCQAGNLAARDAGRSSVACIPTDNWSKGIAPASYDKYCYVAAAK